MHVRSFRFLGIRSSSVILVFTLRNGHDGGSGSDNDGDMKSRIR